MLKGFMHIKHFKRMLIILSFLLVYLSVYLIHNAYGALCISKGNSSSINGDKENFGEGDFDDSKTKTKNLFPTYANLTRDNHTTNHEENSGYYETRSEYEWRSNIELDDIFISVKTTKKNHDSRLKMIVKTWFQLAKDQTWFFTDYHDEAYQNLTNHHMVNTNCSRGHYRQSLCCKMNKELDFFLSTSKKFWCHFDDDNYVNIPMLVKVLQKYQSTGTWYLGKPSISSPIEMFLNPAIKTLEHQTSSEGDNKNQKIRFWFATGGAGFCLSRALAIKIMPLAGNGRLVTIGDRIRFPDDVTLGFIVEYLLKVPLVVVESFHSHLERMDHIENFHNQISFSYAVIKDDWNVVRINGFDTTKDPYRFYSLHCALFPYFSFCNKM